MWRPRAQLPSLLLFTIDNTTAFRAPLQTGRRPSQGSCCTCPRYQETRTPRVRIRVWSITRQCRHPPSMSAGAGLGAESVLASVLGRTGRRCRSLHTPGHCTLGLSSAIRSLHFLAVNMTQKLQCSSNNKGQQLDVNVTNMFPEKYFYSIVSGMFPTVQCPAEIH